MPEPPLILASGSPRRREILGWLGVEFEVIETGVEEVSGGLEPEDLVIENARRKAGAGWETVARAEAVVLGVDTEVFVDGEALGQPRDADAARQRLLLLSGREHEVVSGLCLLGPEAPYGGPRERSGIESSRVTFRELSEGDLELYIASEEWRGRAGGYAIQGLGSTLISRVEGDVSNVIGLPIRLLLALHPTIRENPNPKV